MMVDKFIIVTFFTNKDSIETPPGKVKRFVKLITIQEDCYIFHMRTVIFTIKITHAGKNDEIMHIFIQ
jgi:hypothetical protein